MSERDWREQRKRGMAAIAVSALAGAALWFALGLLSLWARWRGTLYQMRLLHRFAVAMSPMGFVAIIAGWVTTEVGRQPWLVYGHLRTSESMSPLGAPAVATSLLAFVVIYFAVFGVGIWYMLRLMHRPPQELEPRLKDVIEGPIRTAGITPAAQGAAEGEP